MDSLRSSCTDSSSTDATVVKVADDEMVVNADTVTDSTSNLVMFSLSEFNKNRKIIIKNVPPCTYEEVKDFLDGIGVSNMSISKKSRHAIVTLLHGEEAEDAVIQFNGREMLGIDVEVSLFPHEAMLCVAHLPININDAEFRAMVEPFGALEKCFLMRNPKTGKSHGYGFVEFMHNKENTDKVRTLLDGRKVGSCTLRCHFVQDTLLKFVDLRSKCLLVDHLPPDYKNNTELKNIFSQIVTPVFCQVCIHKGEAMGFGVVEFNTPEEAIDTQAARNAHHIHAHCIRVSFCMPGKAASEISNMVLNSQLSHIGHGKPSLLPSPIMHTPSTPQRPPPQHPHGELASPIVKQLLSNSTQGDAILEKFQVVLHQLQQMKKPHKQGLLGDTPYGAPDVSSSPLLNPNLQIALLSVLLATQVQNLLPGLLGSPTMQQTLMSSLQQQIPAQPPSLLTSTRGPAASQQQVSAPLLGNPLIAQANAMLHCLISQQPEDALSSPLIPTQPAQSPAPHVSSAPLTSHSFNNFNELLSTLSKASSSSSAAAVRSGNEEKSAQETETKSGLLGDKPTEESAVPTSNQQQQQPSRAAPPGLLPLPKQNDAHTPLPTGLLGDAPVDRPLLVGMNAEADVTAMTGQDTDTDAIVSQLNPMASQPKSPGSKAMDAGDFLNGKDTEQLNLANPLLALYIESRIRDQLAEFQLGTQPIEPPTPPSMRVPSPPRGGKVPLLPCPSPTATAAPFSKTPGRRPQASSWVPPTAHSWDTQSARPPPLLGQAPSMVPRRPPLFPTPANTNSSSTTTLSSAFSPTVSNDDAGSKKQGLLGDTPYASVIAAAAVASINKETKPSLLPTPVQPQQQEKQHQQHHQQQHHQKHQQHQHHQHQQHQQHQQQQQHAASSNSYSNYYNTPAAPTDYQQANNSTYPTPSYDSSGAYDYSQSYSNSGADSDYATQYEQWNQQWQEYYRQQQPQQGGGAEYNNTPPMPELQPPTTQASAGDATSSSTAPPSDSTSAHWEQTSRHYAEHYQTMCQQYMYQCNMAYSQYYQQGGTYTASTSTPATSTNTYPPPPAAVNMPQPPMSAPPLPPPTEQPPLPPHSMPAATNISVHNIPVPPQPQPSAYQQPLLSQPPQQQKRAHLLPSPDSSYQQQHYQDSSKKRRH